MGTEASLARDTAGFRAETVVTAALNDDAGDWEAYVDRHPDSTGYHSWNWRRVFVGAFRHDPVYLLARRSRQVVGVLPLVHVASALFGRMLTSLPFLNYGGVVSDDDEAASALLQAATDVGRARRSRHIELRHTRRHFPALPYKQHKVTMRLPLEPCMWDRLDRKVRNQIRKAQKSALTAEHGGLELLEAFYLVFARNMRDLGTPVYSCRLFQEVLEAFPDRSRIHVVRLNGAAIAAGLSFRTRAMVEVPWASSIRDYNSLCPNHLLYWSILESSAEAGCEVLDFGRSTPDEGTYKFKEQWGARPVPLFWEYQLLSGAELPDASPKNPKFQMAIDIWKKLPVSIATRLGPRIVRGIP